MSDNFELKQFAIELSSEVSALTETEEGGATKEEKFTEYCLETLSEAGETEGAKACSFIKENRFENIEMKLNGFAISDGFETLDLFISHYRDSDEVFNLKKPEFDSMLNCSKKFLNAALKKHLDGLEPSSEVFGLVEAIQKNRKEIVRVNLFLLSNGIVTQDVPATIDIKGLEEILIQPHVWDMDRLHRLDQSKNQREPITIDFEKTLGVQIPCLSMPSAVDDYNCYLAIIPGQALSTLYRNYGTRLLESNVRAFLQQTGKVNKGIRDTILNAPEMFLPYNNGLAATAIDATVSQDASGAFFLSSVKDFQIVNGGQTTASLFHTQKKHKVALDNVFVQMKLTVVKEEEAKNIIVPAISRYANSQNKVSELDLTSNSPLLQHLEELSMTTYAADPDDQNKQSLWFFERVKGQYKELLSKEPTNGKKLAWKAKRPVSQKIQKSDVAKFINVSKQLPFHVAKGSQKNYVRFLEKAETDFKKSKPGRTYWEDVVASAILFKSTEKIFGRKNHNPIGDTNIRSYCVAYTLSYLQYVMEGKLDLGKIWKEQAIDDLLSAQIRIGLVHVYDFFTSLEVSLVSEAAKSEKTWKRLIEGTHPFDPNVLEQYALSEEELKQRMNRDASSLQSHKQYAELEEIRKVGVRFWDGLLKYNANANALSIIQTNFVDGIYSNLHKGRGLTDAQIRNGLKVLNLLKEQGVDFEAVTAMSSISEGLLSDVSAGFSRLSKLSHEDWDKALALGEQTSSFAYKEIQLIKTIRKKLKSEQGVSPKMIQEGLSCLGKLEKFGLKF